MATTYNIRLVSGRQSYAIGSLDTTALIRLDIHEPFRMIALSRIGVKKGKCIICISNLYVCVKS